MCSELCYHCVDSLGSSVLTPGANRLSTVDRGRFYDPMLACTTRELEGHRVRATHTDRELANAGDSTPTSAASAAKNGDGQVDATRKSTITMGPQWAR